MIQGAFAGVVSNFGMLVPLNDGLLHMLISLAEKITEIIRRAIETCDTWNKVNYNLLCLLPPTASADFE